MSCLPCFSLIFFWFDLEQKKTFESLTPGVWSLKIRSIWHPRNLRAWTLHVASLTWGYLWWVGSVYLSGREEVWCASNCRAEPTQCGIHVWGWWWWQHFWLLLVLTRSSLHLQSGFCFSGKGRESQIVTPSKTTNKLPLHDCFGVVQFGILTGVFLASLLGVAH